MQLIKGETLAPPTSTGGKDSEDHTQQVLRPADGPRRVPGLNEGERPQPA